MNKEEIRLLTAVKERLFTTGWKKGGSGNSDGPNCLIGALYAEHQVLGLDYVSFDKAELTLYNISDDNLGVAHFNDLRSTSFDDVVELLDKAVKVLESE